MDYDDYKRRLDERRRQNLDGLRDAFDEISAKQGGQSFDSIFSNAPPGAQASPKQQPSPEAEQVTEIVAELTRDTTDEDPKHAVLRALTVYRAIVRHAKAGGTVKFVDAAGADKALKVRLKP